MRRVSVALGLALFIGFIGAGCAPPLAQLAPGSAAATSPSLRPPQPSPSPIARPPSSLLPSSTPAGSRFLGQIRYYELPRDPRGEWSTVAPLGSDAVAVALLPSKPPSDEERLQFRMLLGRLDLRTGTVRTLVQLEPGMTMYGTVVVASTIAWVETSPIDLRAYGWKLHLTDADTGADRVVLSDPGVHPEGLDSVIPRFDYDGSSILYTAVAQRQGGVAWELRLLKDGREETIAELADVRNRRFTTLERDKRSVVWLEDHLQPSPHTVIGSYDVATRAVTRRTTAVRASGLALTPERIFLGTNLGVVETDRSASYEPNKVAADGLHVGVLNVFRGHLLYLISNYASEGNIETIDLSTGTRAVLATGSTTGPRLANGVVHWYERAKRDTPARFAIMSP